MKVSQIISNEEIKRGDLIRVGGSLKENESLN